MFANALNAVKGVFVTKPFKPTAFQANPSQLVDALEASFKEMFEIAPNVEKLKTITPRQEYAGGENVFVYAGDRVVVHAKELFRELDEAVTYFAIRSAMIVWSLPETISDEFRRVVMGFAVPMNHMYYSVKHLSFDAGKFAASVTAQLHGTKIAMKQRNRKIRAGVEKGESMQFLHLKQVVVSSGNVLTAQLDSDGTVVLFHSHGDTDAGSVNWHEERSAVKLTRNDKKKYKWNEDEFNAVFVRLVSQHASRFTEELAQAALGAKPLTKSSVVKEFATKQKEAKKAEKAAPAKTEEAAEAASTEAAAEVAPTAEQAPVEQAAADVVDEAAPSVAKEKEAEVAQEEIVEESQAAEGKGTVVDMGELSGVPARQVKPCRDMNAIRIAGKVISKKAKHIGPNDGATEVNTISYVTETKMLYVHGEKFSYSIMCDVQQGQNKSVFALYCDDLQALGAAIGYDFGKFKKEYFIGSNVLMVKLIGNGADIAPIVFNLPAAA
jgi:rRNA-processing protein FCF1